MSEKEQDLVDSFLAGKRVVELADELGEYCGKVLAGLGADVIKVEPPEGETTRHIGPFYRDEQHAERSLHFWHYNYGKRSITIDLDQPEGQEQFAKLVRSADVLLDTRPRGYLASRGLDYEALRTANPGLIYVRISPFGDTGPWADYKASDLVHLALGGVMMNCGYDADVFGNYDTPPIAPQMWQSYHIAGEVTAVQTIAALIYHDATGQGQQLSCSVHDAVSKNTEIDVPDWVYCRLPHARQTCGHSFGLETDIKDRPAYDPATVRISRTKDGRWVYPYRIYLPGFGVPLDAVHNVLKQFGCDFDLGEERYKNARSLRRPENSLHMDAAIDFLISRFKFDRDLWQEGQSEGMPWAPLRRPEENLYDKHWSKRPTFANVDYRELGRSFTQPNAKWYCPEVDWSNQFRAPLLGEHTLEILDQLATSNKQSNHVKVSGKEHKAALSKHGKPFALSGVRIVDLSWLLASGGAGRFFSALGAEVIKVEHKAKPDGLRFGISFVGHDRATRDAATTPLVSRADGTFNRSGAFMEINAGKRSVNLNLKTDRGKKLVEDLIKDADIVIEGFSPGTMDRMGLGYERLREINPRVVYVQQSGFGQLGTYGQLRSYGPTAQAFSGLSEMSGLPEPYAPAGIGYSYLDWFGAYQMALAMMAGLYRQRRTGKGCWIDSSQVELGIHLSGTAILDYVANGRDWARYGNRSPYKLGAPHGAYRTKGEDKWIAISVFDDRQWQKLVEVLGAHSWGSDNRFGSLQARLDNQDALDKLVESATVEREGFDLMEALQSAGVPAGMCQSAEDRCDRDPQLKHLGWQVELDQAEIGRWPVKEVPVSFSETPPYVGGLLDRSGPSYGEDNDYVLRELLQLDDAEIAELKAEGVV